MLTKRGKDARLAVLHQLAMNYLWHQKCIGEWETTCSLSGVDTVDAIEDLKETMEVVEQLMGQLKRVIESNEPNNLHSVNCPKKPHIGTGHLHGEDDDSPYLVDGVSYCGRCHTAL